MNGHTLLARLRELTDAELSNPVVFLDETETEYTIDDVSIDGATGAVHLEGEVYEDGDDDIDEEIEFDDDPEVDDQVRQAPELDDQPTFDAVHGFDDTDDTPNQ